MSLGAIFLKLIIHIRILRRKGLKIDLDFGRITLDLKYVNVALVSEKYVRIFLVFLW